MKGWCSWRSVVWSVRSWRRAVARVLSSVLFVDPFDVVSFGMAFAVLAVVALIANAIPARRAARIDPMVALRSG